MNSTSDATPTPILVVDDEVGICKSLKIVLDRGGYLGFTATSVAAARATLESHPVDLLIVDLDLGSEHGFELCQFVRNSRFSRLPIIVLSAMADYHCRVEGFDHGIDDFVTKPYFKDELLARVRAILRRVNGAVNEGSVRAHSPNPNFRMAHPIEYAEFVLADGQLRPPSSSGIELTQVEERVLNALMQAQGNLIRHLDLVESVWGATRVSKKTMEAHISSLRKKLQACNLRIVSKFGVGYRLESQKDEISHSFARGADPSSISIF